MESNVISPDIESVDAYDALAPFYERHWGTRFFDSATRLFSHLLKNRLKVGAAALDLCCGTGDFAKWLDATGMIVTGVDNSTRMLGYAQAKVPDAQFYKADMRAFQLAFQFDVATCFYNSINQALTLADLRSVLRAVRRHLRVGGWFLFDFVEENGYIDSWEADEVVHLNGRLCEVRYRYDHHLGHAVSHVTIGGTLSEPPHEFVIRQRPLALTTLRAELKHAGFTVESVSSVPNAAPQRGRLVLLARAASPEVAPDFRDRQIAGVEMFAGVPWARAMKSSLPPTELSVVKTDSYEA